MLIDKALFRIGNVSEVVTLESIAQHEDYIVIKDNLYCLTPNCNCKLIYIPQGKKVAHLKKWKGYKHIEVCPYFIDTDQNGRPRRVLGTTVSRLRDEHISKIKKDVYDKLTESDEDRNARLVRQRVKARKRRNSIVETQERLELDDKVVNQATTSLNGDSLREGERNPPVKRRISILDFIFADIGTTVGTGGILTDIKINEKNAVMTIADLNKLSTFNLFLEEVFYSNSGLDIDSMLKTLDSIHSSKEEIIVTAVGEVVFREGQFGMLVMKESDLDFNRVPLATFIMYANTLF